ncbi:MAG: PilZ domain-containing protein, partial [Polyangiaceae bacterium]
TPIRPARDLRPEIHAALGDLLSRVLARNPDERFASMTAVCNAIAGLPSVDPPRIYDDGRDAVERSSPTIADAPVAKGRNASHRRHPRTSYMTLAQLRIGERDTHDGRIEEISVSGFQFVGQRQIPAGTRALVKFALPMSGRVIESAVVARWSRATRALQVSGFEMIEPKSDIVADIHKYVSLMTGAGS